MKLLEFLRLLRRSFVYQVRAFFANSTLHGVKYITAKGGNTWLKFLWFCMTVSATVAALIIIFSVWEKFQTEPTITGVDNDFPSEQMVFPTIAVCPAVSYDGVKISQVANATSESSDGTAEDVTRFLELVSTLSLDKMAEARNLNLPPLQKSLRELAFEVGVSCEQVLKRCEFRGEAIDCCSNYEPLYTEGGFCFVFNSRYKSSIEQDIFMPARHYLQHTDQTWSATVQPLVDAKIFILPYEEVFVPRFYPYLDGLWTDGAGDEGDNYDLLVSKQLAYTTDDCRALSIDQRNCIFGDEIRMKYYDSEYMMTACFSECRIQLALQLCQCNPPFYKPVKAVRMCDIADFPCLLAQKKNITSFTNCMHCEPSCERAEIVIEKFVEKERSRPGVSIIILNWPNFRNKTEILFGWVDLLVALGGIASLFIGFSLLSGVEIIYYFTLRACCMVFTERAELKALEQRQRNRPPPLIDMSWKVGRRFNQTNELEQPEPIEDVPILNRRHLQNDYVKSLWRQPQTFDAKGWQYGQYLP